MADIAQALPAADLTARDRRGNAATVVQRHAELQNIGDILVVRVGRLHPYLEFLAGVTHIGDHQAVDQQHQGATDLARIQPGTRDRIGVELQYQLGSALVRIVLDVLQSAVPRMISLS